MKIVKFKLDNTMGGYDIDWYFREQQLKDLLLLMISHVIWAEGLEIVRHVTAMTEILDKSKYVKN